MELIYFGAKWCAPCKRFRPLVEREAAARNLDLTVVDIDRDPGLATRYGIMSVPTVVAVRNGDVISTFGFIAPSALRARLDDLTA